MTKTNFTPSMNEARLQVASALMALSQAREDQKNAMSNDEYDKAQEEIRHQAWQVAFAAQELTKRALAQVWLEGGMTEETLKGYQHRLNEALYA